MGSNPSTAQSEERFLDAIKDIKTGKEEDIDHVLLRAYYVPDFAPCFSYLDVQQLYFKYPTQVKTLTLKCIEYLVSQKDPKYVQSCISLLARIIPSLSLSVVDVKEIDWLFVGEKCGIVNLFTELKSILFAPLILNQEEADDQLLWFWGTQLRYKIETARANALFLFFMGFDGTFFFPNNPETQEQIKKLVCLDQNVAKYLMNSIAEGIWWHNVHFLTMALPYSSIAMIDDQNFRDAFKDSILMERLTDLTYVLVDDYNVYVHYTYSLTNIEIDLIILSFVCLIIEPKVNFDVQKMAVSAIRFLQLSNESDTKIIGANHRLALSILTIISSIKANTKKLEDPMIANELGTQYKFKTESISLAILEAVTNSVLLIKPESTSIISLIVSAIHNISPFISDSIHAPLLFSKLIEASLIKINDNKNFFNGLVIAIERYVNGGSTNKNTQQSQQKRDELNKIISNMDALKNSENEDLKQKITAAIQSDHIQNDYPLVIDQVGSHLSWCRQIVFELFAKRNQYSLDKIRKTSKEKKKKK